jgi:Dihaem cytochrome c
VSPFALSGRPGWTARWILLLALWARAAHGHEDDLWQVAEENADWRAECGACHMPFPPRMLPSADWQTIMRRLDRHYGADASLDEPVRARIAAFLERNGSRQMFHDTGAELPRITAVDWFERKHQGAIRLWRKGRVKSLADCQSCHRGNER